MKTCNNSNNNTYNYLALKARCWNNNCRNTATKRRHGKIFHLQTKAAFYPPTTVFRWTLKVRCPPLTNRSNNNKQINNQSSRNKAQNWDEQATMNNNNNSNSKQYHIYTMLWTTAVESGVLHVECGCGRSDEAALSVRECVCICAVDCAKWLTLNILILCAIINKLTSNNNNSNMSSNEQ